MIVEMPKKGTIVRRDRDGQLYRVGEFKFITAHDRYFQLVPVWAGRAHTKTVECFLKQYSLAE